MKISLSILRFAAAVLVGIGLVLREHAVTRAEIRPLQIGKDAVLLAGVAPRFVEAAQ